MVLVAATGSPSDARTARPDSAGTIVTSVTPTSTKPKMLSSRGDAGRASPVPAPRRRRLPKIESDPRPELQGLIRDGVPPAASYVSEEGDGQHDGTRQQRPAPQVTVEEGACGQHDRGRYQGHRQGPPQSAWQQDFADVRGVHEQHRIRCQQERVQRQASEESHGSAAT